MGVPDDGGVPFETENAGVRRRQDDGVGSGGESLVSTAAADEGVGMEEVCSGIEGELAAGAEFGC